MFHHAAACARFAEAHARPQRKPLSEGDLIVAEGGGFHDAQVLGIEVETDEVEAATVVFAEQGLDGVAHLVGEEHLAGVFLHDEARSDLVPVVIIVSELQLLRTAEITRVGLGQ